MTRFMADQITNQRLDSDMLLKMAFRRAVLYGAATRGLVTGIRGR